MTEHELPLSTLSLLLPMVGSGQGQGWRRGGQAGPEHEEWGSRWTRTHPRKAGRQWEAGPQVNKGSKPLRVLHLTLFTEPNSKTELLKTLKQASAEYYSPSVGPQNLPG